MENIYNKDYSLEVWGTSLLLAPVIFALGMLISSPSSFYLAPIAPVYFIFIFILSAFTCIPSYSLHAVTLKKLNQFSISNNSKKSVLGLLSIICVVITFYVIDNDFSHSDKIEDWIFFISYCIAIIITSLFYKIDVSTKPLKVKKVKKLKI